LLKIANIEGSGEILFKDGSKYTGAFFKGKMNGPGILLSTAGEKYVGSFLNDQKEGIGILYSKSKMTKRQGVWKKDHRIEWVS